MIKKLGLTRVGAVAHNNVNASDFQGSIVVGISFDCVENRVYWTDLSARTISRASVAPGAEPEILISTSRNTW